MIATNKTLAEATAYLAKHDPALASVITSVGPCTIRPHKQYYQELVDSIISQQLSIKAAATIERRFRELFGASDTFPPPEAILTKNIDELRSVGLSRGKAAYIRDLAQHVVDGRLRFDHLDDLPNDQIITELTAVKGIGEWTAHMFLMFCMGRMDVLAYGDLGIKNGIQKLYGLDHAPTPQEITDIAATHNWHPYETVACWYVWASIDTKPVV
ncbi:MAG TPA: DNA-3-methyladenine glycosylase [Candidatus Saccharimonadales bacterium]|nr:DNA-3-methyladenine glycosylase [Candidatus Saccharimonadales bacterium]